MLCGMNRALDRAATKFAYFPMLGKDASVVV